MRLIFSPDPSSAYWKLNASNPGQFYYNIFSNSGPTSLNITLPYPWVTQGAQPSDAVRKLIKRGKAEASGKAQAPAADKK